MQKIGNRNFIHSPLFHSPLQKFHSPLGESFTRLRSSGIRLSDHASSKYDLQVCCWSILGTAKIGQKLTNCKQIASSKTRKANRKCVNAFQAMCRMAAQHLPRNLMLPSSGLKELAQKKQCALLSLPRKNTTNLLCLPRQIHGTTYFKNNDKRNTDK